ncbi:MAG: M3 family peptidase, partial [Vicinamibacterales bacterium]
MNPTNLLSPWSGPYGGVPPWDRVSPSDFSPALTAVLAEQSETIGAIATNPSPPDFANTIVAIERAGLTKSRVLRMFAVMRLNMSTPEYRALDAQWQPKLAAASDAIIFAPGLFERIDAVYRSLPNAALRADQARLVTLLWDSFVRSGARLGEADRQRLSAINQELASLYA